MIFRLFLLFTLVPLIELSLLIKLGQKIGLGPTILIVVLTGILGAWLAKQQGFITISRIRFSLRSGQVPAEPLLDGVLILAGGLLLVTPGLITDAVGFSVLIPTTREIIKRFLKKKLKQKMDSGEIYTSYTIE
ncbi:membrane protein FxsA [candidate division KSB1 bacterium]|nr:membrane protein FxsA [candidate division KSB1 bacterium]